MPLIMKSAKGIVYVALYVDDNLMVSNINAIDATVTTLKQNGLVLKIMEGLQNCLFCKIRFSTDKNRAWLGQPHLINNLDKKFDKCIQDVHNPKTPGSPKFLIIRLMVESKKISVEDQKEYWSSMGILMYLAKHFCPDVANVMKELLKTNESANPAAYIELIHVINYEFDTNHLSLNIKHTPRIPTNPGILCVSVIAVMLH